MKEKLSALKQRLTEAYDIQSAASLLHWDQTTYMPPGGIEARGRQLAVLERLAHQKFTDPEIGRLLDQLRVYEADLPYDADQASFIRVARRDYERRTSVPADFMAEFSDHSTRSYQQWTVARPDNDFASVIPHLEKTLELSRQLADFFPGYSHIADPLIDFSDPGMKTASVRQIFSRLRQQLVPLVEVISGQPATDDSCLHADFPEDQQIAFGKTVIEQFGYDFNRGRQDKTHHPFMTKFSLGDVRITTRSKLNDISEALFSTTHEAGHALYEQGINRDYEASPLGTGTSSGVHESQSRLWENIVGRSKIFWDHFFPKLQSTFPQQLQRASADEFYRAINKVQRSLIRTDADEITYNLHVMIRFDLELEMLEGHLPIKDLPEAWNERYRSDLGLVPPDNIDGVLQDVHWFHGTIGGSFQGYTLGNILGAQFFETALTDQPTIEAGIATGRFDTLHQWLAENIYQHGSKFTPDELVQRVTGHELTIDPYLRYLRTKYGQLYDL